MKKQMMRSLYLAHPGPHVFLLIINLENFEEDKRNIVEQIQENFGEEALKFTMVPFIGREKSIDEMVKNNEVQYNSNEIFLKHQRKLRNQPERMKQEEVRKRDMKKHGEEERPVQEQKRGINQGDMRMERREYGSTKYKDPRDKDAAVQEDLSRIMMERERERQRGMTAGNLSKQGLGTV
ncbi:GTPase IMAP family member 8-like protein [Labeo rohita]|uniref:GTPase IMAP family member 8-like protein n=1 Tax=Labeo rohita TaxID=84645 RepID=A0A498NYK7_LABRO|nr:GTPase IMAP family member 8-like protein [Labeo rohita]